MIGDMKGKKKIQRREWNEKQSTDSENRRQMKEMRKERKGHSEREYKGKKVRNRKQIGNVKRRDVTE
jgi:hypothetical protein